MDQSQQANLMIWPPIGIGESEALGEAVMKHVEFKRCCPVDLCQMNICSSDRLKRDMNNSLAAVDYR